MFSRSSTTPARAVVPTCISATASRDARRSPTRATFIRTNSFEVRPRWMKRGGRDGRSRSEGGVEVEVPGGQSPRSRHPRNQLGQRLQQLADDLRGHLIDELAL